MKRLAVPLTVTLAVALTGGAALAAWLVTGSGTGRSAALALPAAAAPTVSVTGSTVTVGFAQVSVAGAALGTRTGGGYTVARYDGAGVAQGVTGGCAAVLTGAANPLSCQEPNVPDGTWRYGVTPRLENWRSAESPRTSVTVAAAPVLSNVTATPAANRRTVAVAGRTTADTGSVAVEIFQGATRLSSTPPSTSVFTPAGSLYAWSLTVTPTSRLPVGQSFTARVVHTDGSGRVSAPVVVPFST